MKSTKGFRRGILAAVSAIAAMVALVGPAAVAAETESAIARGGRLYDKWFAENKAAKPTADHPSYPHQGGKYGKDASWRCKECHGWDYRGNEGAYPRVATLPASRASAPPPARTRGNRRRLRKRRTAIPRRSCPPRT